MLLYGFADVVPLLYVGHGLKDYAKNLFPHGFLNSHVL